MAVALNKQSSGLSPDEKGFRSSIEDFLVVTHLLLPLCSSPEEMLTIGELALENDAQLRILIKLVNSLPQETNK